MAFGSSPTMRPSSFESKSVMAEADPSMFSAQAASTVVRRH
jgi:hypothetical protein